MLGALKRRWKTTRRSVSADNQYEAEREGLSEIIASPRYREFLKNYREEAAAIAASTDATLAVSSPRYIEVRKGRIVLESSQQQSPPLPIRNGGAPLPDGEKTDLQHQQQLQHHGRDSVLRINREMAPTGCPMASTTTFPDVGVECEVSTPFPPLPPSPPSSPTVRQGYSPNASSPVHECGKLVRNTSGSVSDSCKNTELLEARIAELEEALLKLQERVNQSQCNSPTLEKEIKEHLEVMSKAMKTKDRKSMQVCREHKTLQVRFQKQENSLMALQNENKSLHQRVRQYETCLDDIMRKVVDALVAEDSLRDEVAILKSRVRDLEAQNAALVTTHASPAKSRDEGYCTMSSGQPQPAAEGHLEELPEEPEQWLMSAEPCTADMEDWSMSQEELATALDEENHEWIWNSSFLTTAETQTEDITALLHDQIVYSEDEEVACTNFTRDFYRLVSFTSGSTRSLHSPVAAGGTIREGSVDLSTSESKDTSCSTLEARGTAKRTVCDSSDEDVNERLSQSPTPSEGGRAQVLSCSSSESSDALTEKLQLPASSSLSASAATTIDEEENDDAVVLRNQTSPKKGAQSLPQSPSRRFTGNKQLEADVVKSPQVLSLNTADLLQDVLITCHNQLKGKAATKPDSSAIARTQSPASPTWRRSTGWRRIQRGNGLHETHIPVPIGAKDRLKSPPPVPIRRTFAS
uniref:Autophagy-related protein 16 domain-containing protein n=1 Tax=Anopheles minimus TaxID=112268 RepID=A0A182WQK6_9DIPT